jgi:hypothetical protein
MRGIGQVVNNGITAEPRRDMPWRQRRLGRAAAVVCAGAATLTITMAVPAAAASGPTDCPGIDLRDPLRSVKCPVDDVARRLFPSQPATSAPAKSPAPDPTSAPAVKRSDGDPAARSTRRAARRPAPAAAPADADGRVRGGAGHGGSATGFSPPIPTTLQLPQAEPPYPYPEVADDPAYDGAPGRTAVRAASAEGTENARFLWARIATALVIALCALHLGVLSRRLRRESDRPLN